MYLLENNHLAIKVRSLGGELTSMRSLQSGIEHLWQADPAVWGWHAPVLFPVVGRCVDDVLRISGVKYPMEKHGFARRAEFDCIAQTPDSLTMQLCSSPTTLLSYPYPFEFTIRYVLDGTTLHQEFEVRNRGNETMYFSLGGHPAFAVPFYAGERYEDYYVEFDRDTILDRHYIDSEGFFDGRTAPVLRDTNQLLLQSNMFAEDAIIVKGLQSKEVRLRCANHTHSLTIGWEGFTDLGLWAKVGASYLCIEPWQGCAETAGQQVDIADKEGIVVLEAGGRRRFEIRVQVS